MRNPNVLNIAVRVKVGKTVTTDGQPPHSACRYVCTATTKFTPFGRFSVRAYGRTQASARKISQGKLLAAVAEAISLQGLRQDQP